MPSKPLHCPFCQAEITEEPRYVMRLESGEIEQEEFTVECPACPASFSIEYVDWHDWQKHGRLFTYSSDDMPPEFTLPPDWPLLLPLDLLRQ